MTMLLTNAIVFDGVDRLDGPRTIVIENDKVVDITTSASASDKETIDCSGCFVLPGLIDAHYHAYSVSFDIWKLEHLPQSFLANHAAMALEGSLRRGFTSIRDAGGGEIGLAMAIEHGLIDGPRFFYSGKALSQTGGHGDFRPPNHYALCDCESHVGLLSRTVDGVDEVRKAVREELRRGASQIKIMASGGTLSPSDPMWMPQLTDDEIRAAVYEASTRRKYVMAHVHTDDAARRCATLGVRTIEHGTMIDTDETARTILDAGAYVVPTLSVAHTVLDNKAALNLTDEMTSKAQAAADKMDEAVRLLERTGVKLGFGTDLLDPRFIDRQSHEFVLRGAISEPIEVLRSATSVNAELMNMSGEIGCLRPGAFADIVVMRSDPIDDLAVMTKPEELRLVMLGGKVRGGSAT